MPVWVTDQRIPVGALLRDPSVTPIVVEHRDRFCRFGSEYVQAAA